ncbi:hypothetical protein EIN_179100 [Entamoeba invadens IP1]|uniref:hypothetical protein n=1 Tax=Entamoeba invadens IP1 TaxID=370355 RepID=UPI0002C3E37B|nr:hypothetical protein EIN_179100 [Entamoeba invadens IP1]ELP93923.1 hypothetical protein EIN_179100 [Entamoeba invadens IP1]|eukprot:XP_004260694.1 hypothetical protein EIN_179100 [Entamoeba invadens IP1]
MFLVLFFVSVFSQQFTCENAEGIDIDVADSLKTITLEVPNNKHQSMSFPGCGDSMNDHTVWYKLHNKLSQQAHLTIRTSQTIPPVSLFVRISTMCPTDTSVNSCDQKTELTNFKNQLSITLPAGKVYYLALFANGVYRYSTQIQITSSPKTESATTTGLPGSVCFTAQIQTIPFFTTMNKNSFFKEGSSFVFWKRFSVSQRSTFVIKTCSPNPHNFKLAFYSECGKQTQNVATTKCPSGYGEVYTVESNPGQLIVQLIGMKKTDLPFAIRPISNTKLSHSDIKNAQQITTPFKEIINFDECHHSSDHCDLTGAQTTAAYYNVVVPIGDKVIIKTGNSLTTVDIKVSVFENLFYNSKCLATMVLKKVDKAQSSVEWKNVDQNEKKITVRVAEATRDSHGEAEVFIDVVPSSITAVESRLIEERAVPHWAPSSVVSRKKWIDETKARRLREIEKNKKRTQLLRPHKPIKQIEEVIQQPHHQPSTLTTPIKVVNPQETPTNTQTQLVKKVEAKKSGSSKILLAIFFVLTGVTVAVVGFVYFKRQNIKSQYIDLID